MQTLESKIPLIKNFDPVADFLLNRLKLTPLRFAVAILLLDMLIDVIMCWYWDLFISKSKTPGFFQDYMALTTDFVFNPVICGLYLWIPIGAKKMYECLNESEIFSSTDAVINAVNDKRALYANRLVFYASFFAAMIYGNSQILEYFGVVPWKSVGGYIDIKPQMAYFRAPFWYITIYATVFIGFNVWVTIRALHSLFHKNIATLQPLHLDRCGGLSCISDFTLKVAYAIGSIGLLLSAATIYDFQHDHLSTAYPLFLGIVAYVVLGPCFFFMPLSSAHKAMYDAKARELARFARLFRTAYSSLTQKMPSNTHDYGAELKKLRDLKRFYALIDRFPVWPFDIQNMRKFMTRITAPILPALVSIVAELAGKKLPWLSTIFK